jgi:poly(A) polymerase Pap1
MTRAELNYEQMIEKHIKALGCTREEAIDIIETDKIIDKGGRTEYDLSIEEEKEAIKIGRVDERKSKSADNLRGKVRAENPTKSGIISNLAEFLTEMSNFKCENVNITNKERQIAFKCGEFDYELTLVQKRKKKGE